MGVAGQTLTLNDSGPYSAPYIPVARARIFDASSALRPTAWAIGRNGPATFQNASGVLATAAANAERIEYASGTLMGLLNEPAASTLLTSTAITAYQATASQPAVADAANGNTTYQITEDTSSPTSLDAHEGYYEQTFPDTNNVASIFVKAGTRNKCGIYFANGDYTNRSVVNFDLVAKTFAFAESVGISRYNGAGIIPFANGWFRIWISTTTSGAFSFLTQLQNASGTQYYTGDGASYIYMSLASLENGPLLTSYIAPGTANRAADAYSFKLAADAVALIFTFDDGTKQTVAGLTGGSTYTIPTSLNRPRIMYIDDSTGATVATPAARRRPLMLLAS